MTAVYRKPTCTGQVLNFDSHHSALANSAVVQALMDRVDTHVGAEAKTAERTKVLEILELNGYPENFIREVERKLKNYKTHELRMSEEMENKDEENGCFTPSLTMPYVRGLSEPVARVLRPLGIRVAHKAEPWKWQLCKRIKDPLPVHKRKGVVYSIEC